MTDPPPPHPLPLDMLILALAHWRDALQEAQTDLFDAARSRDWAIADKARTTIDHTARNIGTAINICQYRLDHPSGLKPPGDA
jgi:hypothetical protein